MHAVSKVNGGVSRSVAALLGDSHIAERLIFSSECVTWDSTRVRTEASQPKGSKGLSRKGEPSAERGEPEELDPRVHENRTLVTSNASASGSRSRNASRYHSSVIA